MDEVLFKSAIAAISSGVYTDDDLKIVKDNLDFLTKKEKKILRKLEKDKNEFVKNKGKTESELKSVRTDIKSIKNVLKKGNHISVVQ